MNSYSYDHINFLRDRTPIAAQKPRCPFCRHPLPGCDCGYDLILQEEKPAPIRQGLRALFALFGVQT